MSECKMAMDRDFLCTYVLFSLSRDPSVKRTLCKRCNTVLMPGITARIRVKRMAFLAVASLALL